VFDDFDAHNGLLYSERFAAAPQIPSAEEEFLEKG
jgi:hypothetical protein